MPLGRWAKTTEGHVTGEAHQMQQALRIIETHWNTFIYTLFHSHIFNLVCVGLYYSTYIYRDYICMCFLFGAQFLSFAGSRSRASRTAGRIKRSVKRFVISKSNDSSDSTNIGPATSFDMLWLCSGHRKFGAFMLWQEFKRALCLWRKTVQQLKPLACFHIFVCFCDILPHYVRQFNALYLMVFVDVSCCVNFRFD
jgi:hypothetical protein